MFVQQISQHILEVGHPKRVRVARTCVEVPDCRGYGVVEVDVFVMWVMSRTHKIAELCNYSHWHAPYWGTYIYVDGLHRAIIWLHHCALMNCLKEPWLTMLPLGLPWNSQTLYSTSLQLQESLQESSWRLTRVSRHTITLQVTRSVTSTYIIYHVNSEFSLLKGGVRPRQRTGNSLYRPCGRRMGISALGHCTCMAVWEEPW